MIVYFTGSLSVRDKLLPAYKKIVSHLKSHAETVISDHMLENSPQYIKKQKPIELQSFQKKVEVWIDECTCLIAETTHPSVSVGYEVGLALQIGKPVLILYEQSSDPPSLFAQHPNENVVTSSYNSHNLHSVLNSFLDFVQKTKEKKFTFYITARHDRYLEINSKQNKVSKSAILRKLIEDNLINKQ